jgi:hypothetical protein
VQPVEALALFLQALGVPGERIPVETAPAAALYRTLLAGRRVLVILDNADSPGQVRPLLPSGQGCRVVVTSRNRLSGLVAREGARGFHLDVLPVPDACLLLARTVGQERVATELEATAELARLCACLPLALRIAAARVGSHPEPIAIQAVELAAGNRLSFLEAGGDDQAAVRAAFGLSYTALPARTRALFRVLGLLPGMDLTSVSAAALAGITAPAAAALLTKLEAAHLVQQRTPGRFAPHSLLRLYAAEPCAQEDGERERVAATTRLLNWYLAGRQRRSGYRFMLRCLGELACSDRERLYRRGSLLCLGWQV